MTTGRPRPATSTPTNAISRETLTETFNVGRTGMPGAGGWLPGGRLARSGQAREAMFQLRGPEGYPRTRRGLGGAGLPKSNSGLEIGRLPDVAGVALRRVFMVRAGHRTRGARRTDAPLDDAGPSRPADRWPAEAGGGGVARPASAPAPACRGWRSLRAMAYDNVIVGPPGRAALAVGTGWQAGARIRRRGAAAPSLLCQSEPDLFFSEHPDDILQRAAGLFREIR